MDCLWSFDINEKNEETPKILSPQPPDSLLAFSTEEFTFVKELPTMIEIECPVCLQVMLNKPHLTSCCGRHFCGPCTKRVQKNKTICPLCKTKNFRAFIDKNRHRIIRELQVYCVNDKYGCVWKGELKNLPQHVNRGERYGECEMEMVRCQYAPKSFWWDNWWGEERETAEGKDSLIKECGSLNHEEGCSLEDKRQNIDMHEKEECPYRSHKCQYCDYKGTYKEVTEIHSNSCIHCPVSCPNSCSQKCNFTKTSLHKHLKEDCPLQLVECQFKWAGCHITPLRKDLTDHITNSDDHYLLLVSSCKQLIRDNEALKTENESLKSENAYLRKLHCS